MSPSSLTQTPTSSGTKPAARVWFGLYSLFLPAAYLVVKAISLFHAKLRESLKGRRGGLAQWRISQNDDRPGVLIHVASRGEFEGARPLIDRLAEAGNIKICVSYSSPSARKAVESTLSISCGGYLPLDFYTNQLELLRRLSPRVVAVFKHDFWPNMIRAAGDLGIPVVIANGNFHPGSRRNLPMIGAFHRVFMRGIDAVWAISDDDAIRARRLLSSRTRVQVVGDTRYDRVRTLAVQGQSRFQALRQALGSDRTIVAGSTWPRCERICWQAFSELRRDFPGLKLVIAPHEPTTAALARNLRAAAEAGVPVKIYSKWQGESIDAPVLMIDRVGDLAELYAVGWVAYVGGGFESGVHSVIEPAAHGLPVAFGSRHQMSHEAGLLIQSGGGFPVNSAGALIRLWRSWLEQPALRDQRAQSALEVVTSREGATEKMLSLLSAYFE